MAKNRLIASDIWADDWFGPLPFFEQALWIGLFSQCADDQGRLLDNPVLIRASVFPYKDIAMADIVKALALFERDGKIHRYQADGKKLIQIVNWWDHQHAQWVQPSQWPSPEGWHDAVRTRMNGTYLSENWDGLRGFQVVPSGDMAPEQTPIVAPERTPIVAPERTTLPTHLGGQDPDPNPDPNPNPGISGAIAPEPADVPAAEEPEPEPAPTKRRPRTDSRSQQPAIRAMHALTGRYPSKAVYDTVITILGIEPDVGRLCACYQEWIERGYNPNSLKWLTEWYANGGPPTRASPRETHEGASHGPPRASPRASPDKASPPDAPIYNSATEQYERLNPETQHWEAVEKDDQGGWRVIPWLSGGDDDGKGD